MLREFSQQHINEDLTETVSDYDNALLFGCKFRKLRGRTFKNCDLNYSEFVTDNIKELLGFTLTLSCHSFKNVRLSPLVFNLLILLLLQTLGNDTKRRKLLSVIGKKTAKELLKRMEELE